MLFETKVQRVVSILKKSKARYAVGVNEGDTIEFKISDLGYRQGSRGLYSTGIDMYVNGNHFATVSQGEFSKVLGVFELEEVSNPITFD